MFHNWTVSRAATVPFKCGDGETQFKLLLPFVEFSHVWLEAASWSSTVPKDPGETA